MAQYQFKRIEPSFEMWPVLKALKANGIWFVVHTPQHLKVRDVNYWPATGRIYVDGAESSLLQTGLDALLDFIQNRNQREQIKRDGSTAPS